MAVLNFFLELLQTPAVILAVVALIGLLAQRKKVPDVLSGTVKTALGYLVLSAGSSLLVTEILPFVGLFQEVFHLSGFVLGRRSSWAPSRSRPRHRFHLGYHHGRRFLVNIVLARLPPQVHLLTGHMMWISSVAVAFPSMKMASAMD
jgi:PTS system ascorbate-specific IIC component